MKSGPAAHPAPLRLQRRCGGTRQATVWECASARSARRPCAVLSAVRRFSAIATALLALSAPCFGEQAQGTQSSEALFRLATTAYRAPDYVRARDLFGKIVLENPLTPFVRDSLFYLAECELVLGGRADAEKRYRTLLSLYPDSPYREAAAFRLADIAWREKKASQALFQLDVLQKQFPSGSFAGSAYCTAADIHFTQKNYGLALVEYDEALARLTEDPGRQSAWYSKGLTLLALGRTNDAQESFARAADGTAADIAEKAGFRRAVLLAGAGNDRDAITALTAFLNRCPASGRAEEAASLLAALLVKSGDSAGALIMWDCLVNGFPASDSLPEYLFKRGEALLAQDRASAALDDFQTVIARFPGSPWSVRCSYSIGYVYSRRAEYPRALPFFLAASQGRAAGELSDRSLFSLGICLYDMGSFEKALERLQELRARKPESISEGAIVVLTGRTLYRMGRLDEAVLRLEEAAKMLSDEPAADGMMGADAAYWLGWAHLRMGRFVEAREAFLVLARQFPADARCIESLLRAGICETMRTDDLAAAALFKEVAASPRSPANDEVREQALYEEGRALDRLGRTEDRNDAFERLAAEYSTGRLAPLAFFKLAEQALALRRYAEAESGFRRVARDFPSSELALRALYWNAHAVSQAGDPRAALDGFWECLARGAKSGLLTTATEAFRTALRVTGDVNLAHSFSDRAAGSQGLAIEAAAGIRLEYAQMLLETNPQGARAVIEEVRRGAPPEPLAGEAILLRGMCDAAVGDWSKAASAFSSLAGGRADEIGARAVGQHARVLEATGRTAEAVDEWLMVWSRFPDFQDLAAEALYNAGRIAHARGDPGRAARIERSLRKAYPDSPWVRKLDETIE